MKNTNLGILITVLCSLSAQISIAQEHLPPVGDEAFEVMKEIYDYDPTFDLEVRILSMEGGPGYMRHKISYRSVSDDLGMGYIAVPQGTGPFPCVLTLHGLTGAKENWWEEGYISGLQMTRKLLAAGYAVVSLDAKYHGERYNEHMEAPGTIVFGHDWGNRSRDMMVQTVVDYRRLIDYLEERPDIDASRLGMVGYSMGGMMTFFLSGVDDRIDVSVACVTPYIPDQYSPMAPHQFAPHVDHPTLTMFGNEDPFYTVESANYLTGLVQSSAKEMVMYDADHQLPVEWTDRALEWFQEYLK